MKTLPKHSMRFAVMGLILGALIWPVGPAVALEITTPVPDTVVYGSGFDVTGLSQGYANVQVTVQAFDTRTHERDGWRTIFQRTVQAGPNGYWSTRVEVQGMVGAYRAIARRGDARGDVVRTFRLEQGSALDHPFLHLDQPYERQTISSVNVVISGTATPEQQVRGTVFGSNGRPVDGKTVATGPLYGRWQMALRIPGQGQYRAVIELLDRRGGPVVATRVNFRYGAVNWEPTGPGGPGPGGPGGPGGGHGGR
jgi:hypothetical protein